MRRSRGRGRTGQAANQAANQARAQQTTRLNTASPAAQPQSTDQAADVADVADRVSQLQLHDQAPTAAAPSDPMADLAACLGVSAVVLAPYSPRLPNVDKAAQRAGLLEALLGLTSNQVEPTAAQRAAATTVLVELELSLSSRLPRILHGQELLSDVIVELTLEEGRRRAEQRAQAAKQEAQASKQEAQASEQRAQAAKRQLALQNAATTLAEMIPNPSQIPTPEHWPSPVTILFPRPAAAASILAHIWETLHPPTDRYKFKMLQVATMSGMGKTTYGANVVAHLLQALRDLDIRQTLPKIRPDTLIDLLEHRTRHVFIDFNAKGDAIQGDENHQDHFWLSRRLVARGLLNVPMTTARTDFKFSRLANTPVDQVVQELWRRQRQAQNIPADQRALLILHIDDHQLAQRDFLLFHGHTADAVSVAMVSAFKAVVNCNADLNSKNTVVLLLTGTSRANMDRLTITEGTVHHLQFEPITASSAFDLLTESWSDKPSIHAMWRAHPEFVQLVRDLGGNPRLIRALTYNYALSKPPPRDYDDVIRTLADVSSELSSVARAYMTSWHNSVNNIISLVYLLLSPIPVSSSLTLGEKSIDQLAFDGFLTLAPHEDRVVVGCPIPMMLAMVFRNEQLASSSVASLFQTPFKSVSNGPLFELVVLFSQTARLHALRNFGQIPASPASPASSSAPSHAPLSSIRELLRVTGALCYADEGTISKSFALSEHYEPVLQTGQILSNSHSTLSMSAMLRGKNGWTTYSYGSPDLQTYATSPQSVCPVVRTEIGTFGVDMWVALPAAPRHKPLLVLYQLKNHKKVDTADADNWRATIRSTFQAVSVANGLYDTLLVFMVTGSASEHQDPSVRLERDRAWARTLVTPPNGQPDPRVIVLMGEDVFNAVPFFRTRLPAATS
ncbi:hypothetical protein CAOG_07513 [Capsaspora owczarzaki ATCC 30864]|uniref:Uncharacterized protein n=1 Tax=Capsaspora owczarzaki (strain ATCC 30864) TaxID=595528 RepID=A0A0D2VZ29_CAPO3|nr:hypothetical protein CAOG_07513 [Capsaspora owczarzaki ATCC 30864]KJE97027.1 hypothetical protein CAOG_007513 [Capsaspora owczarzaki ATCC 30864]|eukprot:XP_004343387.1 hypothetical protein CAOG_07513 [Capsaspora owczarzaki ATCC 30864]